MLNTKDMQNIFQVDNAHMNTLSVSVPNHVRGVVDDRSLSIQIAQVMNLEFSFMENFGNAQVSMGEHYVSRVDKQGDIVRESVITVSAYMDDNTLRNYLVELAFTMTRISGMMRVQYPLDVRVNGALLKFRS